jgi:hypothetical protein
MNADERRSGSKRSQGLQNLAVSTRSRGRF